MTYPIYIGAKKFDELSDLLTGPIAEQARNQNQGTCSIQNDFFEKFKEIIPKLTNVSCNYYDCDGVPALTIKIGNDWTSTIKIDGDTYKRFVLGAPQGHLSKYYKIRVKLD